MQQIDETNSARPRQGSQRMSASCPEYQNDTCSDSRALLVAEIVSLRRQHAERGQTLAYWRAPHVPALPSPWPAAPAPAQQAAPWAGSFRPAAGPPPAPLPERIGWVEGMPSAANLQGAPSEPAAPPSKPDKGPPVSINLPEVRLKRAVDEPRRRLSPGEYNLKRCSMGQRASDFRHSTSSLPCRSLVPPAVAGHFNIMLDRGLDVETAHLLFGISTTRLRRCYRNTKKIAKGERVPPRPKPCFFTEFGERISDNMLQQWVLDHPGSRVAVRDAILTGLGLDPREVMADLHAWEDPSRGLPPAAKRASPPAVAALASIPTCDDLSWLKDLTGLLTGDEPLSGPEAIP